MKISHLAIAIGLACAPFIAQAQGEVLLTTEAKSDAAALDLVTDGAATGFEFVIKVPESAKGGVNTSNCLADLPSTHRGTCTYREEFGDILVIAFSPTNAKLPAGIVPLGTISVGNGAKQLNVQDVIFAGPKGERLPVAQSNGAARSDRPEPGRAAKRSD